MSEQHKPFAAMQRKLEAGDCTNLSDAPRLGPLYVLAEFKEDHDYCDAQLERWVWSIAIAEEDKHFALDGVTYVIPKGRIVASLGTELYGVDGLRCLFLR